MSPSAGVRAVNEFYWPPRSWFQFIGERLLYLILTITTWLQPRQIIIVVIRFLFVLYVQLSTVKTRGKSLFLTCTSQCTETWLSPLLFMQLCLFLTECKPIALCTCGDQNVVFSAMHSSTFFRHCALDLQLEEPKVQWEAPTRFHGFTNCRRVISVLCSLHHVRCFSFHQKENGQVRCKSKYISAI